MISSGRSFGGRPNSSSNSAPERQVYQGATFENGTDRARWKARRRRRAKFAPSGRISLFVPAQSWQSGFRKTVRMRATL